MQVELLIYQGKFDLAEQRLTQLPKLEQYVLLSKLHEKKGEFFLAEQYATLAIKSAQTFQDSIAAAAAMLYALWRQGKYNACLTYFQQLPSDLSRTKTTAKLYNIMGLVHWSQAKYQSMPEQLPKALDFHQQSLQIRIDLHDAMEQSFSYNNLGNTYLLMQQYDNALSYYTRALSIRKELQMTAEIATTLRDIGRLYQQMQKYELAYDYYSRAKVIREQLDNPYELQKINDSINNCST